ncbi:MAG: hypothetical protein JO340_13980 [Acidobacteriaceae bacterium]|nr:hypothetical protein [Acidobacteriaceae bacterium]
MPIHSACSSPSPSLGQVYDCNNVEVNSGQLTASGTGYCNGAFEYCTISDGRPTSPSFSPQQNANAGNTGWLIYEQVGSTPTGGSPVIGPWGCAAGSYAQVPSPPQNVLYPKCPQCISGEGTGNNPDGVCSPPSPIVIDALGEGFHLTSAAKGVNFRERQGDPLVQMSWTDPGFHNAWLVRPNPDGSVTSLAANLFGNLSPQPKSGDPNGYRALAYWAEQSGCGAVDHLDAQNCPAVWTKLRLWQDANQDGVAQAGELHTLEELGVEKISLRFHESRRVDEFGNQFRYVSGIDDADAQRDRRCYDVFLVTRGLTTEEADRRR